MKRKILSMILGTAIAASLLTGCGGSQEAAATTAAAGMFQRSGRRSYRGSQGSNRGRQEGRRCHAYTVIRALD